jgi:Fe-S-cluster-containing dehydrogenase component
MKGWYFIVDVEKCENCNNCFLSCKDEHVGNDWPGYAAPQPNQGPGWIRIMGKERGTFPIIDVAYLPVPCMHCDDAPCVRAGAGAIVKRPDGIVIIDPVKAKGQESLIKACPYGAIQWNGDLALPQKCTLCAHLLDDGWNTTRCIQSCPTGALTIYNLEASDMEALAKTEGLEVYKPDYQTRPRVYYKNLYRFTRCFIAGSVAINVDGKDECAEGAQVTLTKGLTQTIYTTVTDNFGNFKFDNLEESSGKYSLRATLNGYSAKTIEVDLKESLDTGAIFL